MRTKTISKAKLVVNVESNKQDKSIKTISIFDNRTNKYWTEEQIQERGVFYFQNIADLKETLNWNLNGDESKYQFKWGQSGKDKSEGRAYVFQ